MAGHDDCIVCSKQLSDVTALKCTKCSGRYHVGKCSGVKNAAYKAMSADTVHKWQCETCKLHEKRQNGGRTPNPNPSALDQGMDGSAVASLVKQMSEVSEKLSNVLTRIEKIERSIEAEAGKREEMMKKVDETGKTVIGIETSLAFLSSKYDDLIAKAENQGKVIEDLQTKTTALETAIHVRDTEILELRTAIENAEQYSRRKNVEIHGVKQAENEDLMKILADLAGKLELPQPTKQNIEAVHRLGAKQGKATPIIVRFQHRNDRELWAGKRAVLRSEGIFINENLTKHLKHLLWNTKNVAREKGYKFVWVRNGKVFARQREGTAVMRIENEDDLAKLR